MSRADPTVPPGAAVRDLEGKTALVTGASRGIGRAIAETLGRQGARVGVHYHRSREAAESVADAIRQGGGSAFTVAADLSDRSGPKALIAALDEGGLLPDGLDILVNNAGVGLHARIGEVRPDDFDRILQVHFRSPFFLIQGLLPRLRNGGRIINVSSMGTRAAYPRMSVYAPAKAALEALTLLLAAELGERGITVNAVRPGATATDMNERARDEVQAREIARSVALGRVGQPQDIADIVAFLAGDRARWITGQNIDASGGQRL